MQKSISETALRRQIFNMLELKSNQIEKLEVKADMFQDFSTEDYFVQNQIEEETRLRVIHAAREIKIMN